MVRRTTSVIVKLPRSWRLRGGSDLSEMLQRASNPVTSKTRKSQLAACCCAVADSLTVLCVVSVLYCVLCCTAVLYCSLFNFKRLLGRTVDDVELKQDRLFMPGINLGAVNGKQVGYTVNYLDEPMKITPEQVTAAMFSKLKLVAESGLSGQKVSDCVVSCPPYWTDAQRRAMLDAANVAGLNGTSCAVVSCQCAKYPLYCTVLLLTCGDGDMCCVL